MVFLVSVAFSDIAVMVLMYECMMSQITDL